MVLDQVVARIGLPVAHDHDLVVVEVHGRVEVVRLLVVEVFDEGEQGARDSILLSYV